MHFKKKGFKTTNFNFMCGESKIDIVSKYKYLGLWFTDDLNLQYMAEQVSASAHRALGLVIARCKSFGGMPFECYSRLYQSLVQSVLDYGACVWGHKEFDCIMSVEYRAIRFFLGVSKRTTITAIMGDMGWTPQCVNQKLAICRQMRRYSFMDNTRLNLHIIKWAQKSGVKNWINQMQIECGHLGIEPILNFDDCINKNYILYVKNVYMQKYKANWNNSVNQIRGKNNVGLNKLRTYRLFKSEYGTESYVSNFEIKYEDRKALAQMRCGSAPLMIETGRYKNGKYLPEEERLCPICKSDVENEIHVMLHCQLYQDIRDELFDHAVCLNPDFTELCDIEKFKFLMSNIDIMCYSSKACRYIFTRRSLFLTD